LEELLENFKNDIPKTLGHDNVTFIYHHGSRATGEARKDSDYDTILVVKEINEDMLDKIRQILARHSGFQTYLLSERDVKDSNPAQRLEFFSGKKLYGEIEVKAPLQEEVLGELKRIRLDCLQYLRHYITLPHDHEKKTRVTYSLLKDAYTFLKLLNYYDSGVLVNKRKMLMPRIKNLPVNSSLAIEILKTLDSYDEKN
jgi:predicted nucleotidyltransferase